MTTRTDGAPTDDADIIDQMELSQLRYFRAVARHQHVGRAAAELRVAQPSVSRAVIRLERELGAPLLDRVGRGLVLNDLGRRFLTAVDRGLRTIDDGVRELEDAQRPDLGEVTVAAETLLPVTGLAATFGRRHPDATMRLRQASGPQMVRRLARGEVDLCLASQDLGDRGLSRTLLSEEPVLLAMPTAHPLTSCEVVRPADLAGVGVVVPPAGYWQHDLLRTVAAEAGIDPVVACETAEPGATLELARAGLGVTLLPDVARRSSDSTGLAWRPLDSAAAVRRLELVWREDAYLSRTAQAFARLAVEHFAAQVAAASATSRHQASARATSSSSEGASRRGTSSEQPTQEAPNRPR